MSSCLTSPLFVKNTADERDSIVPDLRRFADRLSPARFPSGILPCGTSRFRPGELQPASLRPWRAYGPCERPIGRNQNGKSLGLRRVTAFVALVTDMKARRLTGWIWCGVIVASVLGSTVAKFFSIGLVAIFDPESYRVFWRGLRQRSRSMAAAISSIAIARCNALRDRRYHQFSLAGLARLAFFAP